MDIKYNINISFRKTHFVSF